MSRIYSSLSGGELFEKITSEGYCMSEAEVINYMRQIIEGVKHMHERNIIHLGNYTTAFDNYCYSSLKVFSCLEMPIKVLLSGSNQTFFFCCLVDVFE